MPRTLWNSVAVVSCACILWALFIVPSPANDYYRYGYGAAGALSLLAFLATRTNLRTVGRLLLVLGSFAYLAIPARTFARLLLSGEGALLIQTVSAAFQVAKIHGYSGTQTASWLVDLLIFQVIFSVYFLLILCVVLFASARRLLRGGAQNGA